MSAFGELYRSFRRSARSMRSEGSVRSARRLSAQSLPGADSGYRFGTGGKSSTLLTVDSDYQFGDGGSSSSSKLHSKESSRVSFLDVEFPHADSGSDDGSAYSNEPPPVYHVEFQDASPSQDSPTKSSMKQAKGDKGGNKHISFGPSVAQSRRLHRRNTNEMVATMARYVSEFHPNTEHGDGGSPTQVWSRGATVVARGAAMMRGRIRRVVGDGQGPSGDGDVESSCAAHVRKACPLQYVAPIISPPTPPRSNSRQNRPGFAVC